MHCSVIEHGMTSLSFQIAVRNNEAKLSSQAQHGMGPLINMLKSVCLPLWDNYELYGCKILHIESFSAIESENLVRISKFLV